jgi:CBS domain-containing protein
MLTVRDLMIAHPITLAPDDTLRAAAEVLTAADVGGAPVVSGGLVIGVVTLSDILGFEVDDEAEAQGQLELLAPSPDAPAADADPDWPAEATAESADPPLTGALEQEASETGHLDDHMVAEIMSRRIVHVAPRTPLTDAARIMAREHIHRLVVLENGAAVGILTTFDLARGVASGRLVPAPVPALSA